MAALVLVGSGGWSQRWEIAPGQEEAVRAGLAQVGGDGIGRLRVLDLETASEVELVVAWNSVATAVVIPTAVVDHPAVGQYA
jgi:hypothetical protein